MVKNYVNLKMSMIFEYFTKKCLYFISEYFTYVQSWASPLAAGQAQDLIFCFKFLFFVNTITRR